MENDFNIPPPIVEAFNFNREQIKKARQGDPEAIAVIGNAYFQTKNFEKAFEWYELSAYTSNAHSQQVLGYMYNHGLGVPRDYECAIEWYHKAHDNGHKTVAMNIASLYHFGHGVRQDYKVAMRYYIEAANNDNCFAENNIGLMYERGLGVDKDLQLASEWFGKSADKGYEPARKSLERLESRAYYYKKRETSFNLNAKIAERTLKINEVTNQKLRKELEELKKDESTLKHLYTIYKEEKERCVKLSKEDRIGKIQVIIGEHILNYFETKQ